MTKQLLTLSGSLLAAQAWAHEGHGLPGVSHWHPTDALGYVAAAAAVALLAWLYTRK